MLTTAERLTATIPATSSRPRPRLQPDLSARALLDGGWWPRSADPAAELPGLILAIEERHGPITRIMLGRVGWDASRPRRLRVDGPAGSRVVRLGWFGTMPAGLLTATASRHPSRRHAGQHPAERPGMGRRTGRRQIAADGHIRCELAAVPGS